MGHWGGGTYHVMKIFQPARGSKVTRKFCGKEGEGLWADEATICPHVARDDGARAREKVGGGMAPLATRFRRLCMMEFVHVIPLVCDTRSLQVYYIITTHAEKSQ